MGKFASFTSVVKDEITTKDFSEERLRAVLSAFIRINGKLKISSGEVSLILTTENAKIAKFLYQILQKLYGISPSFSFLKNMRFRKRINYNIAISKNVDDILDDLQVNFLDGKISKSIAYNEDTIGGYFSGAFLASGSVNSPETCNYHLEIAVDNSNYALWLCKLMQKYNNGFFTPKTTGRRNQTIVYIKKSDQIADFLILLGATSACMEFENVRLDRDFANIGNRLQNCDQANFAKTINAAKNQIEDIKIIENTIGIKNLSNEKQRFVARYRLDNEEASMMEIRSALEEEIGKEVTKSNVAHIFRKLHEIAEKYR